MAKTKSVKSSQKEKTVEYTGKDTIALIRLLIRYDIPVLLNGKSSIGKSYTMISIADEWKLPHQLLYIGSEKSEHIEGLPKLVGGKGRTLEYLKPYWFPQDKIITEMVTNGRNLFNDFRDNYLADEFKRDFKYSYDILAKLLHLFGLEHFDSNQKEKEIVLEDKEIEYGSQATVYSTKYKVQREIVDEDEMYDAEGNLILEKYHRDDLRDICVYLCTLLGYGNFWLMLDELDKVDISDVDKYAPLLHIVRERWLKKWKLQPINDGKGISVKKEVKNSNYEAIKKLIDENIKEGTSLLDTRVIAIANKTDQIEPALFRRFIQVVIEELLLLRPNSIPPQEQAIKKCIDEKMKEEKLEESLTEGLSIERINDVNLQWTFNFFPKILNLQDLQGNFIIDNYREVMRENTYKEEDDPDNWEAENNRLAGNTILYKIIRDNFGQIDNNGPKDQSLRLALFDCLSRQISAAPMGGRTLADRVEKHNVELMEDFDGDPKLMLGAIIEDLNNAYPIVAQENKIIELNTWIETCIAYINYSLFRKGKFLQTELSKILIPHIQRLIYMKLTKDDSISTDVKSPLLKSVSQYWEKILSGDNAIPIHKLKFDSDEVQKVMYGATIEELKKVKDAEKVKLSANSIMGAGKFAKTDSDTTKAYQKSLSFAIASEQVTGLMGVLKTFLMNKAKAGQPPLRRLNASIDGSVPLQDYKEYPSFIKYIKDNYTPVIQEQIKLWKASRKPKATDVATETEKLIK